MTYDDDDGYPAESFWPAGSIYAPPWRDREHGERFGPWRGPATPAQAFQELVHWQQSKGGGGLWDYSEAAKCGGTGVKGGVRADRDRIVRYVAATRYALPSRELEVFFMYFDEGSTIRRTAMMTGMSPNTVRAYIARIRGRACRDTRTSD